MQLFIFTSAANCNIENIFFLLMWNTKITLKNYLQYLPTVSTLPFSVATMIIAAKLRQSKPTTTLTITAIITNRLALHTADSSLCGGCLGRGGSLCAGRGGSLRCGRGGSWCSGRGGSWCSGRGGSLRSDWGVPLLTVTEICSNGVYSSWLSPEGRVSLEMIDSKGYYYYTWAESVVFCHHAAQDNSHIRYPVLPFLLYYIYRINIIIYKYYNWLIYYWKFCEATQVIFSVIWNTVFDF